MMLSSTRFAALAILGWSADVAHSERGQELMKEILDAAYVPAGVTADTTSQEFAETLYSTRMKSGGDMDPVLDWKL